MPTSVPKGLTRQHVLSALGELDAGVAHPFGAPRGYELVHDGKRYAPKAVIGLACKHLLGRLLRPDEFSGGEGNGQANPALRRLGFEVVPIRETIEGNASTNREWSREELQTTVAEYLEMLVKELRGEVVNKSEVRRSLLPRLAQRSEGSIEFKFQNISAVLDELGLPYVAGYRPRDNYQFALATEVEDQFGQLSEILEELVAREPPDTPLPVSLAELTFEQVRESPPERTKASQARGTKPWLTRDGKFVDYSARDLSNRTLGLRGELFVLELERQRLKAAGRDDLAARVVHASQEYGDGLGYDILSYDAHDDEEPRLLEVKTTNLGKLAPFQVTLNEVRCSEDVPHRFRLVRVFDFSRRPRLYVLEGSLTETCQLDAIAFRASARPASAPEPD